VTNLLASGNPIDWTALISAVGSIISPLVALLIGWRLARRDALREARINTFAKLSEHMQLLRSHYQRLEDEIINNPELSEDRKNDYLNRIAESVTQLNVDRLMLGLLFGGRIVGPILEPINQMISLSSGPNHLQQMNESIERASQQMKLLGKQYLGI
jgi:hypothetical protein